MAEVVWTVPALNDLERILEYIELDNEIAAKKLAAKVFATTDRLAKYTKSGSKPKELKGTSYRRLVVGPLLIYHREEAERVLIIHVRRGEMRFRMSDIIERE